MTQLTPDKPMTQMYDFQGAMKEMRLRVNALEDRSVKNETKLSVMSTVASLAAAAAFIELMARFAG